MVLMLLIGDGQRLEKFLQMSDFNRLRQVNKTNDVIHEMTIKM